MKTKAILLLAFIIPALLQAQEYKPSINVKKGQEFNYKTNIATVTTQSMGGQEMKYTATVEATIKNIINEVNKDGSASVTSSVWNLTTKANAMMRDTTITMSGKVGNEYTVNYNKYGSLVKREVLGEKKTTPGLSSDLNSGINSTYLFVDFPEKSLKTGDKWVKEKTDTVQQQGFGGTMVLKSKTEYTLGDRQVVNNVKILNISYSSNVEIIGTGNMQGMDLSIEGTGVRSGNSTIDPATGVLQDDRATLELDMTIAITGQQNMTIPMTQKLDITTTLIK